MRETIKDTEKRTSHTEELDAILECILAGHMIIMLTDFLTMLRRDVNV